MRPDALSSAAQRKENAMRSRLLTLMFIAVLTMSFAACSKKNQTQNTAAPAGNASTADQSQSAATSQPPASQPVTSQMAPAQQNPQGQPTAAAPESAQATQQPAPPAP